MNRCICIFNDANSFDSSSEILSLPAMYFMALAAKNFEIKECYTIGDKTDSFESKNLPLIEGGSAFEPLSQRACVYDGILVFFHTLPCVTRETLERLTSSSAALLTDENHAPLALFAPLDIVTKLSGSRETLVDELQALGPVFTEVQKTADDGTVITDGVSLYENQEILRKRINYGHMRHGVTIVDPMTTHISPCALIENGAFIMPGCYIYGSSHIEAMAKIGPNSMIVDSVIGCGTSVNSSQVYESVIGGETKVGPFAYVRPGCQIGDKVKIGDFVELKKAHIGNGTKISHLAYIGDAEFGQRCNIGCGAVVVNYDGKNKYKTNVGDDCFIGCNVNLVSPVNVENGAFIATGTTITDTVPQGAMAIGRVRQEIKDGWATNRRRDGKL